MTVFAGDGVGGEHLHHSAVVLLFLIKGLILEEAMLLDPSGIQDNLGFLIAGAILRDKKDAVWGRSQKSIRQKLTFFESVVE